MAVLIFLMYNYKLTSLDNHKWLRSNKLRVFKLTKLLDYLHMVVDTCYLPGTSRQREGWIFRILTLWHVFKTPQKQNSDG